MIGVTWIVRRVALEIVGRLAVLLVVVGLFRLVVIGGGEQRKVVRYSRSIRRTRHLVLTVGWIVVAVLVRISSTTERVVLGIEFGSTWLTELVQTISLASRVALRRRFLVIFSLSRLIAFTFGAFSASLVLGTVLLVGLLIAIGGLFLARLLSVRRFLVLDARTVGLLCLERLVDLDSLGLRDFGARLLVVSKLARHFRFEFTVVVVDIVARVVILVNDNSGVRLRRVGG